MKIVLCYPALPRHVRQIEAVSALNEVILASQDSINAALPGAEIYCGHARTYVDWESVVRGGKLRWIQSTAAGLDHCLVPAVIASDILVSSASGVFADQVAEHALALLLGLLRRIPLFTHRQRERRFEREPTDDLKGKTVLIAGFGGNGRRIAQLLSLFQVRIVATDCFPRSKPPHVEQLGPPERFSRLLPLADVVILCVPLTDRTRGMLDRSAFRSCKPGTILINVARGPVVVESALVEALRSGQVGAAGLDVTEQEPLPADSELWELPNVLITPHVGAQSADRLDRTTDLFCENLDRFVRGQPVKNLVDKPLGFPIFDW
jgi:D-3-phosphoglycerate dehydrogenase